MRIAGKKLVLVGAVAGVVVCLLAVLALLLPRLVDMDEIGRSALASLQSRYDIRYERVKISILPYPHAVVYETRVTVPDLLTASADSVAVYPKVLPLLMGKFRPAEIDLRNPRVSVKIPDRGASEALAPDAQVSRGAESRDKAFAARLARLKERLLKFQGVLAASVPGIVLDVNGGSLEFYSEKGRAFRFGEINLNAEVLENRVQFYLTSGKSGLWNAFSFSGWIDPGSWRGNGEIGITGGSPQDLVRYFFPSAEMLPGPSRIDLGVGVVANGPLDLRANFTASVPHLTIEDGEEKAVLQNGELGGSVLMNGEGVDFSVSNFRFENPRLSLTGHYTGNHVAHTAVLDIEGRDVDADAVRKVALMIGGRNQVVRRTFKIIRGGEVPSISFKARADSPSDLGEMENFTIRGTMENGKIAPPKTGLLVLQVRGEVVVSDGILDGSGLSGKTALGSSTSGGTLKIGLRKGDVPFHLDLPLDANLAELPEVLERTVKSQGFLHELELMKDVKGRVRGRLILGESTEEVQVRVETGPFELSGGYERFPDPLDIKGASFVLEGSRVEAGPLRVNTGPTDASQLSIAYDWEGEKLLELNCPGHTALAAGLIEPLLRGHEHWKNVLGKAPLKGMFLLDRFQFKGPSGDRARWVFNAEGTPEGVTAVSGHLSAPLTLNGGRFDIDQDTITLKEVNATLADSDLTVSGTLNGYLERLSSVVLTATGRLGPTGNRDIAEIAEFPPELRAIANLTLDHSRFSWENGVKTTFEGGMQIYSGPEVHIKLSHTSDETSIDNLTVRDADSDAEASLKFRKGQFEADFSGSLSNRTVDKLLSENKLLTGPIQGKFHALFYLDTPRRSIAEGQLRISGFQLPFKFGTPARIESATLGAKENRIDVKSAMISWNGTRLSLGGVVTMAEDAYLVDLNAFADDLDLDALLKSKKRETDGPPAGEETVSQQPKRNGWDAPIAGTIHVRSGRITYGELVWNPANAEVSIRPGVYEINVRQANLCGISTPGRIVLTRDGEKMSFSPEARDQDVEPALACLFGKKRLITGKFTLGGNLAAAGKDRIPLETLDGHLDFTAKNGRIYGLNSMVKIMSLLSITEIYRGHLPDLFNEGCPYDTVRIKGQVSGGKLKLSEAVVDGPFLKMVFKGEVDLAKKKIDVVALVSPLKTVDRIVGVVPVVGKLLSGAIISVPVRISGDLSDPTVTPLSPTAVGEELFGLMKRTFQLPFTLLQPLAEGSK